MLTLTVAKAAGAAMLFLAAGAGAWMSARAERERISLLDEQIALVRHIREQIDKYLTPVSEIFRRYDRTALARCVGVSGAEVCEVCDIEGFRAWLAESAYYSDGGRVLDGFLSSLGSSFKEDEVARCDECIERLTALRSGLATKLPKERKSRIILAFCSIAAVVLLLL